MNPANTWGRIQVYKYQTILLPEVSKDCQVVYGGQVDDTKNLKIHSRVLPFWRGGWSGYTTAHVSLGFFRQSIEKIRIQVARPVFLWGFLYLLRHLIQDCDTSQDAKLDTLLV